MKKILLIILIALTGGVFLTGCANTKNENYSKIEEEKVKIAATIFPLYDIVKQVGGNKINPILILPPDASPHTFGISPAQIKKLQNTKLVFSIGGGVDNWLNNITNAIPNTNTFDLSTQIKLTRFDNNSTNHKPDKDAEETSGYDPHYWLNPKNVIIMANSIAKQLSNLDSNNTSYYVLQAKNFTEKLSKKDKEWKEKMSSLNNKDILVFHDAWGYFADHFNLKIVGTFEPFPGKEPSPQYLKELQETIKVTNIKTLFVEPQLSQASITTLAKDLNVKINILDPLGGVSNRDNYIDLIDFNINNIYQLLK